MINLLRCPLSRYRRLRAKSLVPPIKLQRQMCFSLLSDQAKCQKLPIEHPRQMCSSLLSDVEIRMKASW
jgi:hypothetical protein